MGESLRGKAEENIRYVSCITWRGSVKGLWQSVRIPYAREVRCQGDIFFYTVVLTLYWIR